MPKVVCLIIAAQLLLLLPAPSVKGGIPEPYELYGVANQETGEVLPNGSPIRTFIDGVDYSNKTSVFSRPGYSDGFFDVDTNGNMWTTKSQTPWIREGGEENDPIMYTWGDMSNNTQLDASKPWLTGIVFKEAHDWHTGLPPQHGGLNASPMTLQPPLIKIYSIVTNSTISPYTDYAWLCNPTPNPVDASAFYIQKDIPGNMSGPIVAVPAGTIPPYGWYFVETSTKDYFVETGDNVKLVWKNNASEPNAPFDSADIIVDRVEFNMTGGSGTLYWEPGNTIMNNEPAPGRGFQINRSASCRDTNSVQQDFWQFQEIRKNDRPNPPDPVCIQGLCNWDLSDPALYHITVVSNFRINWTHHDPNNDPQVAAVIYIRDALSQVWTDNVGAVQETTYDGLPLLKCHDYWVGVRTKDAGPDYSDVTELLFHTNCVPAPVNRLWPVNGWTTSAKSDQRVWWAYSTESDPGDTLNYTWKVSTTPTYTPLISTGTTQNNYSDPFQTDPSTTYYWCVEVSDGWGAPVSNCGTPWLFMTSTPPTPPTATELKVDGHALGDGYLQRVTNRVPVLSWKFNPLGRMQTGFHIEVKRQSDDLVMWDLNNTGIGGDMPQATYAGTTLVDGACYYFHVKVRDNRVPQLWGDWSAEQLLFCINTPPPTPMPLAPADDSVRQPGSTIIYWSAVTDADTGDAVTYDYCIGTSDPPYPGCNVAGGQLASNNSNGFTTIDGTNYFWAARAFDQHEYSAWSSIWNFTARAAPINTAPTITVTSPTAGMRIQQVTLFTILWTMNDTETPTSQLVVYLNYSFSGDTYPIAGPLVGVVSFSWTVPIIQATDVVIEATVLDEGGLIGWNDSPQFEVYAPINTPPAITLANPPSQIRGGTQYTITWTMRDAETPKGSLVVHLNYSYGGNAFVISGPLVGVESHQWPVPLITATDVRINATVTDDGTVSPSGLKGWGETGNFTIDSTPPSISIYSPTDWNVPLDAEVRVVFSEPVSIGSNSTESSFGLLDTSAGKWVQVNWVRIPLGTWPEEIRFVPTSPLRTCGDFTAFVNDTFSDGVLFDLTNPTSWIFHAVCAPIVSLQTQLAGESWTGGSAHDIAWSMADEIDAQLQVWANYSENGGADGFSHSIYSDTDTVGIVPCTWPVPFIDTTNARIRVTAMDSSGLKSWTESDILTIDSTPPAILSSEPSDGSNGVKLTEDIQIIFTEAIVRATAEQAFSVNPDPGGRTFTWDRTPSGNDILVVGHNPLSPQTDYAVTFNSTLADISDPGNHPSPSLAIRFSTKLPPGVQPPVAKAAGKNQVQVGEPVTLDGSGSTGNITEYKWSITDNQGGIIEVLTGEVVIHTFKDSGRYQVTLTVIDNGTGLDSSDSLEIIVTSNSNIVLLPLFLAAVVLVGAVAGIECVRIPLMTLVLAAVNRRKFDKKDDCLRRGMILGYIMGNPGDNYMDIKNNLKLDNGPLSWHLMRLEKDGEIKARIERTRRTYYPAGVPLPVENGGELHEIERRLLKAVERDTGKQVKMLAEELGVSSQLALYHLRKLSQKGLVSLERRGLRLRASLSPKTK